MATLKNNGLPYEEGDLIIYVRHAVDGRIYEPLVGKFKKYNSDMTGAFIYYHSGETSSLTDINDIYELGNYHYIKTCLGTLDNYN